MYQSGGTLVQRAPPEVHVTSGEKAPRIEKLLFDKVSRIMYAAFYFDAMKDPPAAWLMLHRLAVERIIDPAKTKISKPCSVYHPDWLGRLGRQVHTARLFLWAVKMKQKKLVRGVGINNADYEVQKFETICCVDGKRKRKKVWVCPYYRAWENMLSRCYSAKYQEKQPTYKNCTVSEEWHTFSNFKTWMEAQDWEGLHLDKDLLVEGNKVYSAETCVFVTPMVNSFTLDRGASRGEWLIGTCWDKATGKFMAKCSNPFTKKLENLGRFTCEQEAHEAWAKRKLELAHELAAIQTDPRVAKALIDRYSKPQDENKIN